MGKKVYILFILLILISCMLLFAQRGLKVVVKTSEGPSLTLYEQYRALVIGVSDYLYWPKLPNAVKDARNVAAILRERGFMTRVLGNPDSKEIKGALDRLVFRESGARDGVLIYFAGHGETMILADGTELGYIIPKDCPLPWNDSIGFSRKAISMEDIQTYSLQLKSKHLLALFDSSFSGSIFALGRAAPADITFKTAQPVRQYITAGSGHEIVPDKSIFKRFFLDALEGEADANKDGFVTGSELGLYLESNVVNYSRNAQHPQYGKIRDPNLDKGDFVFVLESERVASPDEDSKPPFPKETEKLNLSGVKEPARQREEVLERWDDWQNKMNSDYRNVEGFDKNPASTREEKKVAWELFLRHYEGNNPFTTKDDELRQRAEQELLKHEIYIGKKRPIALIIGNGRYKSSPLRNPINDAADMASVLGERGFEVILRTDANHKEMEKAIREFGEKLRQGGIGFFYFAGHGMQVKGVNYLVPVDEDIQEEDEIKFKAVDANFVLSKMDSAGNQMNVMILDACRDNPFIRSFRSSARGLAQMDAPRGSLIVYATSPGKTAADGEGRNGIFTKHLLKAIRETNLEVGQLLREVRRGVMNETDSNQIPWESSSLIGNFYFSTLPPEPAETSSVDIASIKKASEERERIKSRWDNWQKRMKSDFTDIEERNKSSAYTRQEKKKAWQQFLDSYKADNPYNGEDEQLRQRAKQRIKELTEPEVKVQARVSLRSNAKSINNDEVKAMLKSRGFFDFERNKSGDFSNKYEAKTLNGENVVIDHATGLMWHQSGSEKLIDYDEAKQWIDELNRRDYAGYTDWRLPTLEEGTSLLESTKMNGRLYIDSKFSAKQTCIWTSDFFSDSLGRVWAVYFIGGTVSRYYTSTVRRDSGDIVAFVRPVRSEQK